MGCGSSAKPTHTGRTASGYRYEKKENCRHYQEKKEPSEEIMTRQVSKRSGDGDDSVSTRASITSTKSSKDMIDWHEKHCTDRDFQYVKKIQEAYPVDEENRKSVGKSNHKSHGGSYNNITVAKMVKHIHCGVCNVLVTKICFGSEEVPFYHCKRCKLNGHKMDLCASCYDAGELATGVRQKTAVSCEARHSYQLAPSLGPGSSPRPSLLDTPLPDEAIFARQTSPVTALGLTEAEVPRSPSRSPRPHPSPRHCDSSTDLSEIRNSLGGKSPRPSPRSKTMPAGLNLPPSSPNARSKSPRPSPRTKTMPAGLLVPSTEEDDAAQHTPRKGSSSLSAQKEAAKKAYLEHAAATKLQATERGRSARKEVAEKKVVEHAAATKLQATERGRSARKEVAEKKVAQADAGHHHKNLHQAAPTLLVPADPVDMIVHKSPRRNSKHSNH